MDEVLFLDSPVVDKPYGGTRLHELFGVGKPDEKIGEYWVISGHDHGPSRIDNGTYKGQLLKDVYKDHRELFAYDSHEKFPLLIKLNQAAQPVSVQVHPSDKQKPGEGKAEFWLFLEAKPGSRIIHGHTAKTKEELRKKIEEKDWKDLLIYEDIHAGDCVFNPPGMIHGQEADDVMCEVQQSSDTTYRIYDYDRLFDGKPRQLHVEQAIEVTEVPSPEAKLYPVKEEENGNTITHYADNEFFRITRYQLTNEVKVKNPKYSLLVIFSGNGTIETEHESYPVHAGMGIVVTGLSSSYVLKGNMDVLVSEPSMQK